MSQALEFMQSMRGQFILSQALCLAIEKLKEVQPEILQEKSNIADMEFLRDELFSIYLAVQVAKRVTGEATDGTY